MTTKTSVLCGVTPCSLVDVYRSFREKFCLHFEVNHGESKFLLKSVNVYHTEQHHFPKKYRYIYLLTPWNKVLLEKQAGFQLVKKFPALHGTLMFIDAFTSARHPSLS
jgi:hypothetical protein